jgi:hypothetical protein
MKVLGEVPKEPLVADSVTIAAVRRFYFQYHVKPLDGQAGVRDANSIKRAFALVMVYVARWQRENGIEGAPKVGHFGLALQEGFTRYTLRHYMNTRVRRVPGVSVTREDRAQWIGHADPQHRMTEFFYESMDPDYLEQVRRAVDAVMEMLDALCRRRLIAPGAVAGSHLAVVEGAADADAKRSAS